MSWLRIDTLIRDNAKILRAARLTGQSKLTVLGFLLSLWGWCLDNAPDGAIPDDDFPELAKNLGWPGDCATLADALIAAGRNGGDGLLERDGDALKVHDWDAWAGAYIRERDAARERMRNKREQEKMFGERSANVPQCSPVRRKKEEGILNLSSADCGPVDCEGDGQEAKGEDPEDPLAAYPVLAGAFGEIVTALKAANRYAKGPQTPAQERDWRKTLADCVRIDGIPEGDLVAALRWLFEAQHPDAQFWRGVVQSIPPLRTARDGKPSKISQIMVKWEKAAAGAEDPWSGDAVLRVAGVAKRIPTQAELDDLGRAMAAGECGSGEGFPRPAAMGGAGR